MLDVFADWEAILTATLTNLSLPVPKFRTGADQVTVAGAPPQIVWVPRSGPVTGRTAMGGDGVGQPRSLYDRNLSVDCYVWSIQAADSDPKQHLAATEALCQHLVAAMYESSFGAIKVERESWDTSAQESGKAGALCILTVTVKFPFVREAEVFSLPIADFPETPVIVTPPGP